ncbi:MAG: protein NinG [Pseudomonas sp.]|nr:protein NinG [Pseudomonas sp.]
MERKPKPKKCKICETEFTPWISTQKVCSPKCGILFVRMQAKEKEEKENRKELKERKQKLMSRSDWLKLAQVEFNKFIRLRDKNDPCISCGRYHEGQYHAGHYRTVGAHPELRFNELNCHKQCSVCNNHKSGNIVEYRINLSKKIGEESLKWLEGPHDPIKLSIEEIKEIRDRYKNKAKELQ